MSNSESICFNTLPNFLLALQRMIFVKLVGPEGRNEIAATVTSWSSSSANI